VEPAPQLRLGPTDTSDVTSVQRRHPEVEVVELRCTEGFGKLLGKVFRAGMPLTIDLENCAELPCADCKRRMKRDDPRIRFVLHRFDWLGVLVDTIVVR
jgi:hypothetical protein